MNRNKLLQIIGKDLFELAEITNEIANTKTVTCGEIDFLSQKAQAICQGFKLLKEQEPSSQDQATQETEELTDTCVSTQESEVPETEEPDVSIEEVIEPEDDFFPEPDKETWFEDTGELVPDEVHEDTQDEIDEWFENIEEPVAGTIMEESTQEEVSEVEQEDQEEAFEMNEEQIEVTEEVSEEVSEEVFDEKGQETNEEDSYESRMQKIGLSSFLPNKEDVLEEPDDIGSQELSNDDLDSVSPEATTEKTVNESFQHVEAIEKKIGELPVRSLDKAIGLNDKFQFIRELFNNDSELFTRTVEDLDKLNNIKEAATYLNKNFKWKKNEFSLKFIQLIKRRFS